MTKQIPKGRGRITLSCFVALKQAFYSSLSSTHNRNETVAGRTLHNFA